jgi:hypothetical protein
VQMRADAASDLREGRSRKTAMIGVNPESTPESVASVISGLSALGFTATYVFSVGIGEPSRVVELIAGAAALGG